MTNPFCGEKICSALALLIDESFLAIQARGYAVLTSNTSCQIIVNVILKYHIQLNKNCCVKNVFTHTKGIVLSTHFPILKSISACVWACVSNCFYLKGLNSNNW